MIFYFYYSKTHNKPAIEVNGKLHLFTNVEIRVPIESVYRKGESPHFLMKGHCSFVTTNEYEDKITVE